MPKIMYQIYVEFADSDGNFQPKQPEGKPLHNEAVAAHLVEFMQEALSFMRAHYSYEEVKTDA